MLSWYYSKDNAQLGPVPFEELRQKFASGELDTQATLVWNETLPEWCPAHSLPEFANPTDPLPHLPASPPPVSGLDAGLSQATDPYAPPSAVLHDSGTIDDFEIVQPRPQLDIGFCIRQGWHHTIDNYGSIFLLGLVYVGISMAVGIFSSVVVLPFQDNELVFISISSLVNIASNVLDLFLGLGMTRIALDVLGGQRVNIGDLFSQGDKLLRVIGATIIYALIVIGGLLLLIIPGIIWAIQFGQYQNAIVDRNLGVMDSLKYSSALTRENRLNLFALGIVIFAIVIAGALALIFGLLLAIPVVWLTSIVAYRYLQLGPQRIHERLRLLPAAPPNPGMPTVAG